MGIKCENVAIRHDRGKPDHYYTDHHYVLCHGKAYIVVIGFTPVMLSDVMLFDR